MLPPEINKIFKRPGEKRYDYFLKEVHKSEEVYGLADAEGWALLGDNDDADILPLFPTAALAEAFRQAVKFHDYQVAILDLNELIHWLEDMEKEDMLVAVLPNPRLNGAVVEPTHLKADLQALFDKEKD